MKNVPNIITSSRILLSIILLLLRPFSTLFLIIYTICGLSDIFDGYIARKADSPSRLGAVLDSIADIMFLCAVGVVLIPVISIPTGILIWIALIAVIRIAALLVAYHKYHAFATLHTYANKATGLLLFCSIYLYNFVDINILGCIVCIAASIAAIEELIIHIKSKELSRNTIGIFSKHNL